MITKLDSWPVDVIRGCSHILSAKNGGGPDGLVLYSYKGPGEHVTLSLRACETNSFCFQLYWLIELYMGHIRLDCGKAVTVRLNSKLFSERKLHKIEPL